MESCPIVLFPSLVVFQSALDLEGLPPAFVVADIRETPELTVVEFDAAGTLGCNVRFAAEFVETLAGSWIIVRLDGSDGEEIFFINWRSPSMLRNHRGQQRALHRWLPHDTAFRCHLIKATLTRVYTEGNSYIRRPETQPHE